MSYLSDLGITAVELQPIHQFYSLNMRTPHALQMIMDSLRYWILEMHVDGFRFDLAATLARELHNVDKLSAFFDIIQQDPVINQVKVSPSPGISAKAGTNRSKNAVNHFQPKWVNTTNTQPYMPSQKTPVENLFLAGSHTQTQAHVWSIEGAVESGRRAAKAIDRRVTVIDRVAKRREVKIGARRPGEVEIVNGLKAGEFVIIHGTLRARPDQEVKIIAAETGEEFLEQLLK